MLFSKLWDKVSPFLDTNNLLSKRSLLFLYISYQNAGLNAFYSIRKCQNSSLGNRMLDFKAGSNIIFTLCNSKFSCLSQLKQQGMSPLTNSILSVPRKSAKGSVNLGCFS